MQVLAQILRLLAFFGRFFLDYFLFPYNAFFMLSEHLFVIFTATLELFFEF